MKFLILIAVFSASLCFAGERRFSTNEAVNSDIVRTFNENVDIQNRAIEQERQRRANRTVGERIGR